MAAIASRPSHCVSSLKTVLLHRAQLALIIIIISPWLTTDCLFIFFPHLRTVDSYYQLLYNAVMIISLIVPPPPPPPDLLGSKVSFLLFLTQFLLSSE